ncbi:MAG: hypothetical protein Q9184_003151 [Pyrenodesmia sp. 2 TL-2023]
MDAPVQSTVVLGILTQSLEKMITINSTLKLARRGLVCKRKTFSSSRVARLVVIHMRQAMKPRKHCINTLVRCMKHSSLPIILLAAVEFSMMIALQILITLTLGLAHASILPRQGVCVPPNCAKSGEYIIYNCGTAIGGIQSMLDTLYGALVKAVQDAQSDIPSPAYRTFLKDPESTAMVSSILAQAAGGAAIYPPNPFTDGAPSPPVFYCLDRVGQLAGRKAYQNHEPFDAFDTCVNPENHQTTGTSAIQMTGLPYMGICPYFWESGLGGSFAIPSSGNCLTVNSRNRFNVDRLGRAGPKITQRGMFVLLEEIIHLYLWPEEQKRGITKHLEVYDANDVLKLAPQDAIMNAASYVLYVASIYGDCTDFPTPPGTQDGRRIGLEVDATTEEVPPGPIFTGNPVAVTDGISEIVVTPVQPGS